MSERVATLDIGTNTLLLLIAEKDASGTWQPVVERARIEGLGKGVDATRRLDPARVAGALDAVAEYAECIRQAGVTRVAAVGTQALREAENGGAFVGPAEELLGCGIEIISGDREAELSFLAVTRSVSAAGAGDVLVFDVGGGSTELITGRDGRKTSARSVAVGAVRMTERFVASDPPTSNELDALRSGIETGLGEVPRAPTVVGVAGTVTTLAAIVLGLESYDGAKVHGLRIPTHEVQTQVVRISAMTLAQREALPGLPPKRAPLMVAGAAIVERVLAASGASELTVSDRGVRWGLVHDLARPT